jgi:lipopolysaccharide heptosyltransferase I
VNVAIVKLSSLGDVVHALPVAATLAGRVPGVRLTWIVEAREAVVLRGHPALAEVVTVDTRRWRRARDGRSAAEAVRAVRALRRRLREAGYDVVFDLQGLLKSGLLAFFTGAPLRVGFSARRCREPLAALFTNCRVTPPPSARHVVHQYLALLEPLGLREPVLDFRLPSDPAAEAAADEFLAQAGLKPRGRLVVLNPGAGRADKRWPADAFGALARRLAEEAAAHVVVVWGPGEEATARAIVGAAGLGRALLAPPTDLLQLVALLRRASVVVAGDTGPLHLAAALDVPCVGLYGPTRAERNGPYGPRHRALQAPGGRVAALGVAEVLGAVLEALG